MPDIYNTAIIVLGVLRSHGVGQVSPYVWLIIIGGCLLSLAIRFIIPIIRLTSKLFFNSMGALKTILQRKKIRYITGIEDLDRAIAAAGYTYDIYQDVFFSTFGAWQRNMGYCRLYDEAAAPLGMIIDCEPIPFDYNGKRWLIEFWKGQYDMTTGCEIGVYTTTQPDIDIPGVFSGPFYDCASNTDQLPVSFILKKNGKVLFARRGRHWWLTGFKLGEFSELSELTMHVEITLKDIAMRDAFLNGLRNAGYAMNEIMITRNTVALEFDKPRTKQPDSRSEETDPLIQHKNKSLCDHYQQITSPYDNMPDKARAIQREAPEIYSHLYDIGKSERLFWNRSKINIYPKGTFGKSVNSSLTRAFETAQRIEYNDSSKFVIMSDCHRADGSAADDFAKNHNIFYAALQQYYNQNYHYIEIGDGDECWEVRNFSEITGIYSDVFSLLNKFDARGMFCQIYGNHDMVKKYPDFTTRNLSLFNNRSENVYVQLYSNSKIHEGLVLRHEMSGLEILLVHGHQVDCLNDKFWKLARFLVRYLWRPLELFGINDPTRTAKNYKKKNMIDNRLTEWVIREKRILIAGHTHRPMFPDVGQPPYFNDGSCVHPQGITALEIENGYIKLVKWSYKSKAHGTLYVGKDIIAGPSKLENYIQKEAEEE